MSVLVPLEAKEWKEVEDQVEEEEEKVEEGKVKGVRWETSKGIAYWESRNAEVAIGNEITNNSFGNSYLKIP